MIFIDNFYWFIARLLYMTSYAFSVWPQEILASNNKYLVIKYSRKKLNSWRPPIHVPMLITRKWLMRQYFRYEKINSDIVQESVMKDWCALSHAVHFSRYAFYTRVRHKSLASLASTSSIPMYVRRKLGQFPRAAITRYALSRCPP